MRVDVTIHPGSSQKKIIKKDNIYHVYVHSRAEKGKANRESIESLAEFFNLPESSITIKKGQISRKKIIEIPLTGK